MRYTTRGPEGRFVKEIKRSSLLKLVLMSEFSKICKIDRNVSVMGTEYEIIYYDGFDYYIKEIDFLYSEKSKGWFLDLFFQKKMVKTTRIYERQCYVNVFYHNIIYIKTI